MCLLYVSYRRSVYNVIYKTKEHGKNAQSHVLYIMQNVENKQIQKIVYI